MKKTIHIFFVLFLAFAWITASAQDASVTNISGSKVSTEILNPMAECTGTGSIIYDDGTFENGYSANPAVVTLARFVQLVTPLEYPWQFNTFCVAFTKVAASPPDFTFSLIVYTNDGPGGQPGTVVHTIAGLTASNIPVYPTFAWYDYDISTTPALVAGSYFIGIEFVPANPSPHYSGADESVTTPLQTGYWWNNNANVWATIQSGFANYRAMGYRTLGSSGPPCPVGAPTNPFPANGATNVPISGNTATWTNGSGTTQVELWFGPQGSLTQVYSGAAISSFALPTLNYATTYGWYVKCGDGTCFTQGPTWSFTTIPDPNLSEWCDPFTNLANWTIIGPLGTANWSANNSSSAGGTPPELRMSWTPSFNGLSVIRSVTIPLLNNTLTNYAFNYYFDYFGAPSGTVIVGVTYDGGTTVTPLYTQVDATGNVGPLLVSGSFTTPASGAANAQLIVSFNGNSFNNDNIYWDNMCLDWVVPVELTSFTATADFGVVELSWITATETNNQGFEVQRSNGSEFETIAFVEGHGTTTEVQAYSYTDRNVTEGSYSYRLKQIDFDGTFEYSNVVEVDVSSPAVYALEQNYPNPFNPSTKIAFRLAVDSKVSLKVFDVLGQEVATLVNTNLGVGAHNVDFNASSLNSGVYFYRIEATGIDGTNFVDVKKMILTK